VVDLFPSTSSKLRLSSLSVRVLSELGDADGCWRLISSETMFVFWSEMASERSVVYLLVIVSDLNYTSGLSVFLEESNGVACDILITLFVAGLILS
jgi:hypothetical protein